MAWALVGTAAAASQGAASAAVTPAWGTSQNRTAGNLLICMVGGTAVATLPTTPSGWSIAKQQAGTSCSSTIYWKKAAGADAAPTIALATSAIWSVQLAEYSGNPNVLAIDKSGSTSGTASPSTSTANAADVAPGDLVLGCWSEYRSMTATSTYTVAFNNGATATNTSNTGTTTASHYGFSWGTTTGNASADTYSVSGFSTSQLTGTSNALVTFSLPPAGIEAMSGTAGMTVGAAIMTTSGVVAHAAAALLLINPTITQFSGVAQVATAGMTVAATSGPPPAVQILQSGTFSSFGFGTNGPSVTLPNPISAGTKLIVIAMGFTWAAQNQDWGGGPGPWTTPTWYTGVPANFAGAVPPFVQVADIPYRYEDGSTVTSPISVLPGIAGGRMTMWMCDSTSVVGTSPNISCQWTGTPTDTMIFLEVAGLPAGSTGQIDGTPGVASGNTQTARGVAAYTSSVAGEMLLNIYGSNNAAGPEVWIPPAGSTDVIDVNNGNQGNNGNGNANLGIAQSWSTGGAESPGAFSTTASNPGNYGAWFSIVLALAGGTGGGPATVTGAVTLSGSAGMTVGGLVKEIAATTLSATAGLTVQGTRQQFSTAPLAATAGMTIGGIVTEKAATTLAASAGLTVTATSGPPIVPPPVAGYSAWYDASQITGQADNTPLSTWSDLSGHGNDVVQATSTYRPIYYSSTKTINGLPVVQFDGVDDNMAASATTGAPYSVFMVLDELQAGTNETVFASALTTGTELSIVNSQIWIGDQGVAWVAQSPSVVPVATPCIIGFTYDGTTIRFYVNSPTPDSSGSISYTLSAGVTELGGTQGPLNVLNGLMAEVISYPTGLNTTNAASVINYLAAKWIAAAPVDTGTVSLSASAGMTVGGTRAQMASISMSVTSRMISRLMTEPFEVPPPWAAGSTAFVPSGGGHINNALTVVGTATYTIFPRQFTNIYVDIWWYSTSTSANDTILQLCAPAGTPVVTLQTNAFRTISAKAGGAGGLLINNSTATVPNNEWHHLECYALVDNSVGVIRAKLDSVEFAVLTGYDTQPGATSLIQTLVLGNASNSATHSFDELSLYTDGISATDIPYITSFSPPSCTTGPPADVLVTVTGGYFQPGMSVIFNNAQMVPTTYVDPNTLTFTISAGTVPSAGNVPVYIYAATVFEHPGIPNSATVQYPIGANVITGSVTLSGTGGLTVSAQDIEFATVPLAASAGMTIGSVVTQKASVVQAATTGMTVGTVVTEIASVTLSATAGMTVTPLVTEKAATILAATTSMTVGATVPTAGAVLLAGSSSLTVVSRVTEVSTVNLAGTAGMTISSLVTELAAVSMSGATSLNIAQQGIDLGIVVMSATTSLTVTAKDIQFAAVTMSATAGLTGIPLPMTITGQVAMSSTAGMTAAGVIREVSAVVLSATAGLTATTDLFQTIHGQVDMASVAALNTNALLVRTATVSMGAVASLVTMATITLVGEPSLIATTSMTVSAHVTEIVRVDMLARSSMMVSATVVPVGFQMPSLADQIIAVADEDPMQLGATAYADRVFSQKMMADTE